MTIPKHLIEELARAWASIDGRADRFDIGKSWEGSQSESPDGGTYGGYLADTEELVRRSPSVAAALSDDLPFRHDDIMRGLILFRTSNNAHGYTNFVSLTAKVDALPQAAKDELATMMRNFADGLSIQKEKCAICEGEHDNDLLADICTSCETRIHEEGSP